MKIIIIGPVYPFKGGIAHYTSMLSLALKRNHVVNILSFKLQYPHLIYGKEQYEYEDESFKTGNTSYLINTINPISWIKTLKDIEFQKPDLVIVQWWHPYFSICYHFILKGLKKAKILFVCHNVFPHERFPFDRSLSRIVLRLGDLFIVHSKQDAFDLRSIVPNANFEVAFHPTYNIFKFQNISFLEAREELGIGKDKKVMLFFGFVRQYKGLKYLLNALPLLKDRYKDILLLIVGDFGGQRDQYQELIDINRDNISIYDSYIPNVEVEKFFVACDIVVLPYISATQSGIIQIAYGFNKPIIATNVGGLPEVVIHGKTGYVVEPKNPQAIANAVVRFFEENKAIDFANYIEEIQYKYSWDRITEVVEKLYNTTLSN